MAGSQDQATLTQRLLCTLVSAGEQLAIVSQKGVAMPSEDYKALTLRLYTTIGEVFRTGDVGLLDPLLSPDMVDHTPASGPITGREPGKQLIAGFARAFP